MDDFCAVCAEPLQWVAYGACGHRDVCSTCTVRLRVVLDDKRCCICKQESESVFVTKALGDYTKVLSDFSSLPRRTINESTRQGEFWFDSYVGAYFDDEDEYKRIKAMCKLQCKLCEAADAPVNGSVRKDFEFKSLEVLRRHLFGVHRLTMCGLCLEGRKVFIQDQKLYTKGQLERHSQGDSFIDGNEEERAGFTGHPLCNFCSRRFYGDNELYQHMSTEHFTCHLCKRTRPERFDYYRNYDDLEAHFRNDHVLCEHSECLAKKFIVFNSESEFKIHNVKEHGGNLSRGERRAAMKISVSSHEFRHGQSNNRRGSFHRGTRDSGRGHDLNAELFSAMRDSMETATLEDALRESAANTSSSSPPSITQDHFPALGRPADAETSAEVDRRPPSWTVGGRLENANLNDSSFPPLAGGAQPIAQQVQGRPMASLFTSRGRNIKVLNQAQAGSAQRTQPTATHPSSANRLQGDWPGLGKGKSTGATTRGPGYQQQPAAVASNAHDATPVPLPSTSTGAASATPLQLPMGMDEIRTANKLLVENIRGLLKGNEEQFAEFKQVHAEFRNGNISAKNYYDRVARLGLTVIIPELARLCPDPQKQQELQMVLQGSEAMGSGQIDRKTGKSQVEEQPRVQERHKMPRQVEKGSGQEEVEVLSTDGYRSIRGRFPGASFSGNGLNVLFKADSSRPSAAAEGPATNDTAEWSCESCTLVNPSSSSQCGACGRNQAVDETKKQLKKKKKKLPKYDRVRLGEEAAAAAAEDNSSEDERQKQQQQQQQPSSSVRGAWKNGGGQKLMASATAAASSSSFAWNNNSNNH